MIEQFIQQQCDAITVAANDPDALAPAMKKARRCRHRHRRVGRRRGGRLPRRLRQPGYLRGHRLRARRRHGQADDGKGEFLVVTGSLTAPNQVAWLKEMRERMKEKYPEMSIDSVEPGEEDLQLGIDITKNYLRANPDTAGVFGITSVALPGAAEAVEQVGP